VAYQREPKTVRTHNSVSVPATNGTNTSAWIDVEGYNAIAITFTNSVAGNNAVDLEWSHDGTNKAIAVTILATNTAQERVGTSAVYSRWVRAVVKNTHTTAATMNAWIYARQ
jgi:hypothetical protein